MGFWVKLQKFKDIQNFKLLNHNGYSEIFPINQQTKKTLIFLHGAGNTCNMYYNLFMSKYSPVCQNTKIILPQAPLRYLGISKQKVKMPGWYNIFSISNDDRRKHPPEQLYDLNDINQQQQIIQQIIDQEYEKCNGNLFMGGISQGCSMALHAGLRQNKKLQGIIALSGYFMDFGDIHENNKDTPVYVSWGINDNIISEEYMLKTFNQLRKYNPNVFINYVEDLGHTINENQCNKIKEWYESL